MKNYPQDTNELRQSLRKAGYDREANTLAFAIRAHRNAVEDGRTDDAVRLRNRVTVLCDSARGLLAAKNQ